MILYTSDIDKKRVQALAIARNYLFISLFVAMFGGIYEYFSFGVYSFYMIYAFAFPLVGGVLLWFMIGISRRAAVPGGFFRNLWHAGIATLTIGSIFTGILEIYGTTSPLTAVYWFAGLLLLAVSLFGLFKRGAANHYAGMVRQQ